MISLHDFILSFHLMKTKLCSKKKSTPTRKVTVARINERASKRQHWIERQTHVSDQYEAKIFGWKHTD